MNIQHWLRASHVSLAGRGWEASELRLKSFEDLHKLWYVLLAERNRLETIRGYCRTKHIEMPNYGRLGKVGRRTHRLRQTNSIC